MHIYCIYCMALTDMMMPRIVLSGDDFQDHFAIFSLWWRCCLKLLFFEDCAMDKLRGREGPRQNGEYWENGKSNGNQLQEVAIANNEN